MNLDSVLYGGEEFNGFDSSNIEWFQYQYDEETLTVAFSSGDIYDYFGVPPEVVEEFYYAESKGKYHAANIKWDYDYSKR